MGVEIPARESLSRQGGRIDWWGNTTFALGLGAILVGLTYGIQPYGFKEHFWTCAHPQEPFLTYDSVHKPGPRADARNDYPSGDDRALQLRGLLGPSMCQGPGSRSAASASSKTRVVSATLPRARSVRSPRPVGRRIPHRSGRVFCTRPTRPAGRRRRAARRCTTMTGAFLSLRRCTSGS
jgi:hypothetical protein